MREILETKENISDKILDLIRHMIGQHGITNHEMPKSIFISENILKYISNYLSCYAWAYKEITERYFMGIRVYVIVDDGIINMGGLCQKLQVPEYLSENKEEV